MRHAVTAAENHHRDAGHAEPSAIDNELFLHSQSQTPEHDLVELSHADEIGRNVTLTQPQVPQAPCSSAQHFSILSRDHPHRFVGRNIPQTTTMGNPSLASGQLEEEEVDEDAQERPLRMTSVGRAAAGRQAAERTGPAPLPPFSSMEMAPALRSMPLAAVATRRPSSRVSSSVHQDSSDSVQANALQQRRRGSLQSPTLGRITTPDARGSLIGTPGRRRPVPPALRRGSHASLEFPGSPMRRVSVQPRQGVVFSRTATTSFPIDRRSSY